MLRALYAQLLLRALHDGVKELTQRGTFQGYGPEQGHRFLIDKIFRT